MNFHIQILWLVDYVLQHEIQPSSWKLKRYLRILAVLSNTVLRNWSGVICSVSIMSKCYLRLQDQEHGGQLHNDIFFFSQRHSVCRSWCFIIFSGTFFSIPLSLGSDCQCHKCCFSLFLQLWLGMKTNLARFILKTAGLWFMNIDSYPSLCLKIPWPSMSWGTKWKRGRT